MADPSTLIAIAAVVAALDVAKAAIAKVRYNGRGSTRKLIEQTHSRTLVLQNEVDTLCRKIENHDALAVDFRESVRDIVGEVRDVRERVVKLEVKSSG